MEGLKIAGCIFLSTAAALCLIAVVVYRLIAGTKKKCYARADGYITEIKEKLFATAKRQRQPMCYAIVSYSAKGKSSGFYTVQRKVGINKNLSHYQIGDPFQVMYDPANPEHAYVDGDLIGHQIAFVACFGIACILAIIGIAFLQVAL